MQLSLPLSAPPPIVSLSCDSCCLSLAGMDFLLPREEALSATGEAAAVMFMGDTMSPGIVAPRGWAADGWPGIWQKMKVFFHAVMPLILEFEYFALREHKKSHRRWRGGKSSKHSGIFLTRLHRRTRTKHQSLGLWSWLDVGRLLRSSP